MAAFCAAKRVFVMLCAVSLAATEVAAATRLCSSISLSEAEISPGLSDTEKRMVCGDPELEPWRVIPPAQAEFHLRNFLQQRGYHHPRFRRDGQHLNVDIGSITRAERVELADPLRPEFAEIDLRRKRNIAGQPLTPTLLSSLEQWVNARLQAMGYPCPAVTTLADPDTGVVRLEIREGPRQRLDSISGDGIPGLIPGILRRYDAFRLGDWLNADWLVVSANRAMLDNLVENLHHRIACGTGGEGARVQEIPAVGPPRVLTLGFGINTEGVLAARASWRNTRLGPKGSSFDLVALASAREQRLDLGLDWYHLPFPSRRFIRPEARIRHQNEEPFETFDAGALLSYGTSWDGRSWGWTGYLGPALTAVRTFRGDGPPDSHFLTLDAQWRVRSHAFEFYAADPRKGFQGSLFASFGARGLASSATVQRLLFRGLHLWNYRDYDPPLWIFGLRTELGATLTPERPGPGTLLPPNFFRYLGGSANVRGFSRQELPLGGQGALTSLYLGAELRLPSLLPARLEPLVFLDVGALGIDTFRLDRPFYASPGIGLRWFSPFGTFRTTAAHGFPSDVGHWQFYFSYGEEF